MMYSLEAINKQRRQAQERKFNQYIKEDKGSLGVMSRQLASQKIKITCHRNLRDLMLYPFCSTSKRKRVKNIEYSSANGSYYLTVSANHNYGMAKIWDFDILRYALTKGGEVKYITQHFPSSVEFSVYECLKFIGKNPLSGKNHQWLRQALRRLMSTTYVSNIFGTTGKFEEGFTLISYELIEKKNKPEKIRITFNDRIVNSIVLYNSLLAIDPEILREKSGIRKRLLELVKVSMGNDSAWQVSLKRLQKLCVHEGDIKYLKRELNKYKLPWKIEMSRNLNNEEFVTFTKATS